MKKVLGATFLLFYTGFTVVAISQRTASVASTIARNSSSHSNSVRAASPHASQVRILEEPYIGLQEKAALTPARTVLAAVCPLLQQFEGDSSRFTPSRAPPTFL